MGMKHIITMTNGVVRTWVLHTLYSTSALPLPEVQDSTTSSYRPSDGSHQAAMFCLEGEVNETLQGY